MSQNSNFQEYIPKDFSDRLKLIRNSVDYTQEELAEKIDVSRDTVLRWENPNHKALPSVQDLFKLCNLYECELSYLLGEQECMIKDAQAIHDYTGLSERAIRVLHEIKLLEENNPSRISHLSAINLIISEAGLEFLSYIQTVMGAKVLMRKCLDEIPDTFNSDDIAAVSDYETKLESRQTHLNYTKDEAVEALRRFMQESLNLRETEGAAAKKSKELISILMSS